MQTPEQRKQYEGWMNARKRTCLRCGEVFITRKNKTIHSSRRPRCEPAPPVEAPTVKYF